MTAKHPAEAKVHQYMRARPGQVTTVADVVRDLGIPSSTASACLSRFAADASTGISRVGSRGSYVYNRSRKAPQGGGPKAMAVGELAECIGHTDDGYPIMRDTAQRHYVARPVK